MMIKTWIYLISICFLVGTVSCESCTQDSWGHNETSQQPTRPTANIIDIAPEQLLKLLKYDKNVFVVDVRKADTAIRQCKMIKDYRHIEDSLIYHDLHLLPENKSIVLISKTGQRSLQLARYLANNNIGVYNLKGGMDAYWGWREKLIREKLKIYDKEIDVIELFADDFGC